MHRFHRVLVDFDRDEFAGLSSERLFAWIERLPAYEGALAARLHHLREEAKKRNPSRAAIQAGATEYDSVAAIAADPVFKEHVQYETV